MSEKNCSYKYCIVPKCRNTTVTSRNKYFFPVPRDKILRKSWCTIMKRFDKEPLSHKTSLYCCEDHFDIEMDTENYIKYKLVGGILKLKSGIVPHKFHCHKVAKLLVERSGAKKRRRTNFLSKLSTKDESKYLSSKPVEVVCDSVELYKPEYTDADPLSNDFTTEPIVQGKNNNSKKRFKSERLQIDIKINRRDKGTQTFVRESSKSSLAKRELIFSENVSETSSACSYAIGTNVSSSSTSVTLQENESVDLYRKATIVDSMNVAPSSEGQGNMLQIKEECGLIDIEPTEFQHMDSYYKSNQTAMNSIKQENTLGNAGNIPILCFKVKEENIEDIHTDSYTPREVEREIHDTSSTITQSNELNLRKELLVSIFGVQLEKEESLWCHVCDAVYTDNSKLLQHVHEVHGSASPTLLSVKSQGSSGTLKCVTESASQTYQCEDCLRIFHSKDNIRKHCERVHRKESHMCTICYKEFKCKSYLLLHIRNVHSGQHYECAICKRMCKSKYSFYYHVKSHHGESTGLPFSICTCDICFKTFDSKKSIRTHIRQVHGMETHKCTQCNKQYKCRQYLLAHMRLVHSAHRYGCAVCKSICKTKQGLHLHVLRQHGQRVQESQRSLLNDSITDAYLK